jgi:hypothetical protein
MKTSKFTEEQIAYALRQVEGGTSVGEVCRRLGSSEQTCPTPNPENGTSEIANAVLINVLFIDPPSAAHFRMARSFCIMRRSYPSLSKCVAKLCLSWLALGLWLAQAITQCCFPPIARGLFC